MKITAEEQYQRQLCNLCKLIADPEFNIVSSAYQMEKVIVEALKKEFPELNKNLSWDECNITDDKLDQFFKKRKSY